MYTWMGQRNQKVTDWPRPTTLPFDLKARETFLSQRAQGQQGLLHRQRRLVRPVQRGRTRQFCRPRPEWPRVRNDDARRPWPHRRRSEVSATQFSQGRAGAHDQAVDDGVGTESSPVGSGLLSDGRHARCKRSRQRLENHVSVWPVPHTPTDYHLHANGSLGTHLPAKDASLTYTYDPKDPAPQRRRQLCARRQERPIGSASLEVPQRHFAFCQ